jgi:hypothetical protein
MPTGRSPLSAGSTRCRTYDRVSLHLVKAQLSAPLLGLADETDIRPTHPVPLRLVRVLRAVEHEHLAVDRLRREQVRVLRHVPRAVDLARVVDALHDLHAPRERVPAQLATRVVVRAPVEHVRAPPTGAQGDLHGRDLQVVACLPGCVRAEEDAVRAVRLVGVSECSRSVGCEYKVGRAHIRLFVGEPLARQARPIERMRNDKVVQVWRVLLPIRGSARTKLASKHAHQILYSWAYVQY